MNDKSTAEPASLTAIGTSDRDHPFALTGSQTRSLLQVSAGLAQNSKLAELVMDRNQFPRSLYGPAATLQAGLRNKAPKKLRPVVFVSFLFANSIAYKANLLTAYMAQATGQIKRLRSRAALERYTELTFAIPLLASRWHSSDRKTYPLSGSLANSPMPPSTLCSQPCGCVLTSRGLETGNRSGLASHYSCGCSLARSMLTRLTGPVRPASPCT